MHTTRVRALAAAAVAVTALVSLEASSPRFFTASSQADFLKGDVENLSIDANGRLTLAQATELVYETPAPFVWSLLPAADGAVFVGTGNKGQVYRIDAEGKGALFFDSSELEVHALAPAPGGGLYVATSPDGRIYKVERDGTAKTYFDPEDKYIWALVADAKGNLYAGTGDKGVVYRVSPDGAGVPFYKTKATHATALAFDRDGNLLVGTGSPARVLRVDAQGKAFVLLDTPYQEIRSLRVDAAGNIYVAAVNGRPASGAGASEGSTIAVGTSDASRSPVPSVSTEITSVAIIDVSGGSSATPAAPADRRSSRGSVYRVAPDGQWDQLWDSREDSPYDLSFDEAGSIIVATGNKGKVYRLEGDPVQATLLTRAAAQQVTALYRDPKGRLYLAGANPGKLFRLSSARALKGSYESEARDAQVLSTWGMLSWRGTTPTGATVEVFTRSGNSETPDETWSAWSAAHTRADGSPITSPRARYLQWKAVLSAPPPGAGSSTAAGGGPVVTSVTAAYLQRNLRPQVRSITVHPPGIVFQKPFTTGEPELAGFDDQTTPERKLSNAAMTASSGSGSPALGRRTYAKGLQTLAWKADDENDDELVYDVLFRREGDTTWKPLRRGLNDSITVWDTTTVPNGTYFVRVVASDGPSNPRATALAGELDSSAIEIDNTAPVITVRQTRAEPARTVVVFDVNDDHSPIQRVEYSIDGQRWTAVFPKDGMADSKSEAYELVLEGRLDERGLTLRASDTMSNSSTAHVEGAKR